MDVTVPDTASSGEPIPLLAPKEGYGIGVVYLRNSLQIAADISVHKNNGTHDTRSHSDPPQALCQHEHRIVATDVVCSAVLHQSLPDAVGGSGWTMMDEKQIVEAFCAPSLGICFDFIHCVPTRGGP